MSFWIWLEKGQCMPGNDTPGRRFACWFGRKMACRHPKVFIDSTAQISPNARIHPRCGKIVIGKNSSVAPNAVIQGNVVLGENTSVQYNTMLVGYGKPDEKQGMICIGSNVRIAANCMVIAANHIFRDPNIPSKAWRLHPLPLRITCGLAAAFISRQESPSARGLSLAQAVLSPKTFRPTLLP